MGWGIDFPADIYLNRQNYNENESIVEDAITECENTINNIKTQINMFASSSVPDILPEEWNDEPIRWINNQIDELINNLHEEIIKMYQLTLYLEYLREKNKKDD